MPLSKPGWIRFLGWLSLGLLVTPLCWPLAEMISGHDIPRTVIPGFMWVAFFPCFVVWLFASIVHTIVRWSARAKVEMELAKMPPALRAAALARMGQAPPATAPADPRGATHILTPGPEVRK